ncbi:MAG: hypothetical protein MUF31_13920 [Akkermansiaceae bacterium]|jgi:thiol:disulfide interchange protein DsbD|nr:hypothetical protein [Akkermansiaceae bacterium]
MQKTAAILAMMLGGGLCLAGERSGKAEVDLISSASAYQAGHPLMVGVRMKIDPGWHTYWTNPGEGGMPISVKWKLPEGWEAGPVLHPVPISFKTGDLPGYGYEGQVILPVFLTPGPEGGGKVSLAAEVAWLTCDDSACVPGDATLSLDLDAGAGEPTPEAVEIEAALDRVPQPMDGASLVVKEEAGKLLLTARLPAELDASGASWMPATPSVVDLAEPIQAVRDGDSWTATVKKHEYASGPATALELVLSGGKLQAPLLLSWEKDP